MDVFKLLHEQYTQLREKLNEESDGLSFDLLQNSINEEYYNRVEQATSLLCRFYETKLVPLNLHNSLTYRLNDNHYENLKICMLIDLERSYEGLGHSTSFNTPEGIALMILLDKMIGNKEIVTYDHLAKVSIATISLIDIIPALSGCSDFLGDRYSLYIASLLNKKYPEAEKLYRRLIYHLCKTIAEVDGEISPSEEEWLREIALLNDDDPNNDIDISNL